MFIPANEIRVGDKCITIKEIECLAGMFTVGTPVTVTGIGDRGYDLVDDFGNVITELFIVLCFYEVNISL